MKERTGKKSVQRGKLYKMFFNFILTRCTSMKLGFQTTDGAPEQFVL